MVMMKGDHDGDDDGVGGNCVDGDVGVIMTILMVVMIIKTQAHRCLPTSFLMYIKIILLLSHCLNASD